MKAASGIPCPACGEASPVWDSMGGDTYLHPVCGFVCDAGTLLLLRLTLAVEHLADNVQELTDVVRGRDV